MRLSATSSLPSSFLRLVPLLVAVALSVAIAVQASEHTLVLKPKDPRRKGMVFDGDTWTPVSPSGGPRRGLVPPGMPAPPLPPVLAPTNTALPMPTPGVVPQPLNITPPIPKKTTGLFGKKNKSNELKPPKAPKKSDKGKQKKTETAPTGDINHIDVPDDLPSSNMLAKVFNYIELNDPCELELYRGSAPTTKPMAITIMNGLARGESLETILAPALRSEILKAVVLAVGRATKLILTHSPTQIIPLDEWKAGVPFLWQVPPPKMSAADIDVNQVRAFFANHPAAPEKIALRDQVLVHLMSLIRVRPSKPPPADPSTPVDPFDFPQAQKNLIFAFPSMLFHMPMTTTDEVRIAKPVGQLVLELFKVLVVHFDTLFPNLVAKVADNVQRITAQPNGQCPPPGQG